MAKELQSWFTLRAELSWALRRKQKSERGVIGCDSSCGREAAEIAITGRKRPRLWKAFALCLMAMRQSIVSLKFNYIAATEWLLVGKDLLHCCQLLPFGFCYSNAATTLLWLCWSCSDQERSITTCLWEPVGKCNRARCLKVVDLKAPDTTLWVLEATRYWTHLTCLENCHSWSSFIVNKAHSYVLLKCVLSYLLLQEHRHESVEKTHLGPRKCRTLCHQMCLPESSRTEWKLVARPERVIIGRQAFVKSFPISNWLDWTFGGKSRWLGAAV